MPGGLRAARVNAGTSREARCSPPPLPTSPAPQCAAVGKITGKEGLVFEGRALCFNCEEDMIEALAKDPNQFRVSHIVVMGMNHLSHWTWGRCLT